MELITAKNTSTSAQAYKDITSCTINHHKTIETVAILPYYKSMSI